MGMIVVVLADTHAPRRWRRCPPALAHYLPGADLILHAGDVCTADVLDELAAYAPVRVDRGIRIFNPGSPTDRRRQPCGTFGLLHIDNGQLVAATIIPLSG